MHESYKNWPWFSYSVQECTTTLLRITNDILELGGGMVAKILNWSNFCPDTPIDPWIVTIQLRTPKNYSRFSYDSENLSIRDRSGDSWS